MADRQTAVTLTAGGSSGCRNAARRVASATDRIQIVARERKVQHVQAAVCDPPRSPQGAVDEHVAAPELAGRIEGGGGLGVEEARAVGVGEEHVVVLGQEPHRRGYLRVGQLAVRDIPQRSPCLIRPLPELRAEAVEDGGDAREPGPRRDVRRGRRAERAQVAEDEVVDGGRGGERTPEPRLGRRHRDLMRAAEEPARRHLHEGEVVPAGVRERGRVVRGKALAQRCAERGQGERLLAQQRTRPLEDRIEIDAGEGRPHLGMRGQLPVEDGPEQRPEREAVVGRQQMDGAADRGDPDHLPLDEQRPQVGCGERLPGATRGAGYGFVGTCAWSPTRWCTADSASSGARSSRSCRCSVVRFSVRAVIASHVTGDGRTESS